MDPVSARFKSVDVEWDGKYLKIMPHEDLDFELEDLMEFQEVIEGLTDHAEFLVLSDYREYHLSLSKSLLETAAKDERINRYKIAEAVIIESLPNRLIANFYIKFLKPLTPTRIFNSEKQALKWLENQYSKWQFDS